MAKNNKLETGIGGKKTSYEEDLKAARKLVAEKQKILDKGKDEAKQAEKTLKTNEKNLKALEDANKSKNELLKKQNELLKKDIELTKEEKKRLETAEKIIALKTKEISSSKNAIKDANTILKIQEKNTKEKEKAEKAEKALLGKEKERQKNLRKILIDTEELDNLTGSITSNTQAYGKEFKKTLPNVKTIKDTLSSVATIVTKLPESQKGLSKQVQVVTQSYKNLNVSIVSSKKELADNTITQEQFNKTIVDSYKEFDKLISKIDTSTKEGRELVKIYSEQKNKIGEQVDIQKLITQSEIDRIDGIKALNSAIDRVNSGQEKNLKIIELVNARQSTIKDNLNNIAEITSKLPESQSELKKQADATADAYVNFENSIISAQSQLDNGKIKQEEYNKLIVESYKDYEKLISKIDTSTEKGRELVEIYTKQKNELSGQVNIQGKLGEYEKNRIKGVQDLNTQFSKTNLQYEKYSELAELSQVRQKEIEDGLTSISNIIASIPDEQAEFKNQATAAADAYVDLETTIINSKKQLQDGKITLEEYNQLIKDSNDDFQKQIGLIDASTDAGKALVETFQDASDSTKDFVEKAEKSKKQLDTLNTALDELGSSGIPAVSELSQVFQKLANKDIPGAKLAIVALGAVIGKLATDYFAAPFQVDIEFRNERIENQINALKQFGEVEVAVQAKGDTKAMSALPTNRGAAPQMQEVMKQATGKEASDVSMKDLYLAKEKGAIELEVAKQKEDIDVDINNVAKKNQRELEKSQKENALELVKLQNEAAFAGERAANSFAASMKSAAAEFRSASKTALFGNKLGGVGYGAAQLQMAGISADKIAGAMSAASAATGQMPTGKAAADMAIMADRTGQSVESIAEMNEFFQATEKVSAEAAMNMQEGMRALADNAGVSLGNLMQEVASASKEALGYQIKSGKALAKQVAYAQSMGVNFGDVAKAGKSMVLNYKESIKAEMQLSTLLGEQVDLSEVRAKFAEGDTAGALDALKAQGLNPEDMDMFQQEALSQALGGLDLGSLQKIATKDGKTAELGAGKAGAANKDYLQRNVAAQASLNAEQAQISAQSAIIDAKTSQKALESLLQSKDYAAAQQAILEQQKKDADLEGQIRYEKVEKGLNDEMLAREKAQGLLEKTYDTLTESLKTFNDNIRQAAIQTKQFAPEKTASENVLGGVGAALGGIVASTLTNIGSDFLQKKLTGKTSTPSAPSTTSTPSAPSTPSTKSKGGNIKKMLIGTAITAVAAWGVSKLFGGKEEPKKDAAKPSTVTPPAAAAVTPIAAPTVTPGEQVAPGAAIASNDICSCIGNAITVLKGQTDLLKEQIYTSQQFSSENEAGLKAAMLSAGLGGLKDKIVHIAEEKAIEKVEHFGSKVLAKKAGTTAAETGGKTIAQKVGLTAVKKGGTELIEKVAETSIGKALEKGGTKLGASMFGKVASKAAGGGPIGLITGVVGGLADMYGEYKKEQAVQTGDTGALQTGRAASAVGTTLEYAGYGAMIGSIIPGVGTAVGASLGTIVGGIKGIYDNWFSVDAAKMDAQVEMQGTLNAINTQMFNTMKESMENQKVFSALSDDEPSWRQAMLEQTVEFTRLLDAIAFDILPGIYNETLNDDKTLDKVGRQDYNKAAMVGAKRLGVGAELDAREQNIANMIKQAGGQASGMVKAGGKEMSLADYKKQYNVSDKEYQAVMRKTELNSVAASTKASQAAATPAAGTTVAPAATTTAKGTTTTATTATTTTAAATPAPATTPAVSLATEATQKLIQTQADSRGILMYGLMQTMNNTLNSLVTVGQVSTTDSILTMIQQEANARGIAMYSLMQMMNISLNNMASKAITATNPLENAANTATIQTAKINSNIAKNEYVTATNSQKLNEKVANLSNQAAQLVQVNKNLQSLLDAFLTNNQNDGQIRLLIDGKQVTRVIKRREDNETATSPETP